MSDIRKNDLLKLRIEEVNNLGCGVGHVEEDGAPGRVVFVRDAVTGDEVLARVIKAQKSYLVARIEELLSPSPLRVEDACKARGCGGCVYRKISYEQELRMKRSYVENAFRKAGLSDVFVGEVQSTGVTEGYRNKAQYPVANGKDGMQVGFFATGTHRVVPTEECLLQPPIFGEICRFICSFCDKNNIRAYEEETGRGLLRHIYLRSGARTGEILVTLVVNGKRLPAEERLAYGLAKAFPSVVGILINVNEKNTNVVLGKDDRTLFGRAELEDELCGRRFRIAPHAFYQVNHDACELLYGIAKEKAALTGNETLLDLYCGIGTIGISMADRAGRVVGIEIVEEAVQCANANAERNHISNASFYCGDASDARRLLENAERLGGRITDATVILDPPRKGSTEELISYLAERRFGRIVYVSCNPDTLARDCVLFRALGYEIGEVTPVDLFPRTGHVESVVCLTRKSQ